MILRISNKPLLFQITGAFQRARCYNKPYEMDNSFERIRGTRFYDSLHDRGTSDFCSILLCGGQADRSKQCHVYYHSQNQTVADSHLHNGVWGCIRTELELDGNKRGFNPRRPFLSVCVWHGYETSYPLHLGESGIARSKWRGVDDSRKSNRRSKGRRIKW